ALRDALSIFDQIVTFAGNNVTYQNVLDNLNILDYDYYFRIVEAGQKEDIPSCLLLLNDIVEKGFDPHHFVIGLAEHYRNLLVCKDPRTAKLLEVAESVQQKYLEQSKVLDTQLLLRAIAILSKTDIEYKAAKSPRLLVEIALMQLCSLKSELEKKKSFTDPVAILPFKGQNLRDLAPKPVSKPNTNQRSVVEVPEPKMKALKVPTGALKTTNLSIKQILKDEREKNVQVPVEDLPHESFSIDQLKMYWRQYAYQAKERSEITLYNAMVKRDPILVDGKTIRVEVDNTVQMGFLANVQQEMTDFFRSNLKNYSIMIEPFQTDQVDEEDQYKSPKDQFATLARKYPNLHSFKSAFNLDFEF
ncbi:MAG: hypothetical protein ACSHXL_04290, partial [Bacteroidota bacterium]